MDRMFTRTNIDFDKLHGEIRENLARQRELTSGGFKAYRNQGVAYGFVDRWARAYSGGPESELTYLRTRHTVLCSILNYAKGRNHFTKLHKSFSKHPVRFSEVKVLTEETEESLQKLHEKIMGDEWKQFLKPVEQPAVASM